MFGRPKLHQEAGAVGNRFVAQASTMRAQNRPRDIESKPNRRGTRLERLEEFFGMRHAGAGVAESDYYQIVLQGRRNMNLTTRAAIHRLLAIPGKVDEYLQQTLVIRMNARKIAA